MTSILFALALKLVHVALPENHPFVLRAQIAARIMADEIPAAYASLSADEQSKRASIAIVWGFHESGLRANPAGNNDKGAACGFGQVHLAAFPPGTFPATMTCASIRADLATGIRAQLLALRYFETKCGSLPKALTAYSTNGACPALSILPTLVRNRCAEAGYPHCL